MKGTDITESDELYTNDWLQWTPWNVNLVCNLIILRKANLLGDWGEVTAAGSCAFMWGHEAWHLWLQGCPVMTWLQDICTVWEWTYGSDMWEEKKKVLLTIKHS